MKENKKIWLVIIIIICLHIFVLSKLIFFPYPELFIYPYLTNNGILPYKQILDQHFPGLFFLPINLNNLGLLTAEISRVWLYGVVILTQSLIFIVARKITKSNYLALSANFLYLCWQPFLAGWSLWIDSFLPIIVLPAFLLTYQYIESNKKVTKIIFFAGLLLGLGIVFKQVLLPLVALSSLFLILQRIKFKDFLYYLLGILIPVLLMIFYLIVIGVWSDFWYWTVVYNLTIYSQYGRKAAPAIGFLTRVIFIFGSSVLFILSKNKNLVSLLGIYLVGTLICVYGRFDFIYFQTALPFGILGTVLGIQNLKNKKLRIGVVVIYLLIASWWINIFYKGHLGEQVLSFDSQTLQIADKVRLYTEPKDKIFLLGTAPHIYQMTNTLPAGNLFVFQFPWFYKVAEDRILNGIKEDKPNYVVIDDTAIIEGVTVKEFAPKIYRYLLENYHQIDIVGKAKILQKNETK